MNTTMVNSGTSKRSDEINRLACLIKLAQESKWQTKFLILIRGLPGSGKTNLASYLVRNLKHFVVGSEDEYFLLPGQPYCYRRSELDCAQAACRQKVWTALICQVPAIVVDNCNLKFADMESYVIEAVKYGYTIHLVEPDVPWRYEPDQLAKRTHNGYTANEIERMLSQFDRSISAEDLVNQAKKRLTTLQNSDCNSPKPNDDQCLNPKPIENPSTNPSDADNQLSECENQIPDPEIPLVEEKDKSEADQSQDEESNDQEGWKTPPSTIGDLTNNRLPIATSIDPLLQTNSNTNNTIKPSSINKTSTVSTPSSSNDEPVPSTSYGPEIVLLRSMFPSLTVREIEDFLNLAHGDTEWASTLILDSGTLERKESGVKPKPNMGISGSCSISDDLVQNEMSVIEIGNVVDANEVLSNANLSNEDSQPKPSQCAQSLISDQQSLPSSVQESNQLNDKGIRISRDFIEAAHEQYGFALGSGSIDFSSEAIPDFIFDEWTPEPKLVQQIYESFLRHIGFDANASLSKIDCDRPNRPSYAKNQKRTGMRSNHMTPQTSFKEIMEDDEAMRRSINDFRDSLDAPAIRHILERLLAKFPGTQRPVVEEAFVRCQFSELEAENYLINNFKSIRLARLSMAEKSQNEISDTDANKPKAGKTQDEQLSLQEIHEEEEAIHRSVEDQREVLQTLSNQLCLSRLQSQFPGMDLKHLEYLFIRFDLNETALVEHLVAEGFKPSTVEPLINRTVKPNIQSQPILVSGGDNEEPNEWDLGPIAEQIIETRQRIQLLNRRISYQTDNRIKQFYQSELQLLRNELSCLQLQRAELLVGSRSSLHESKLLQEGESKSLAALKALAHLDLHGLDKSSAVSLLRNRLDYLNMKAQTMPNRRLPISHMTVIAGRGAGSEIDIVPTSPILRPAVIHFLASNGYIFEEAYKHGSGCFKVNLRLRKRQGPNN